MMPDWLEHILRGFDTFILWYFLALNGSYIVLCLLSFRVIQYHLRYVRIIHEARLLRSALAPPVSIICPAYNEEATIVASLQSLLTLEYSDYEVVVVNDGSADRTLEILKGAFQLELAPRAPSGDITTAPVRGVYRSLTHPNLMVIDKVNGASKADALNAGVNFTRNPLFCAIDADSVLEADAIVKLVRPFLHCPETIAAGGIVRIVNGSDVKRGRVLDPQLHTSHLIRLQVVEYLRAFLFGRVGWAALNALPIVSGAFGMFARRSVLEVGGYRHESIGEDMELVMRLHRHNLARKRPYRISFVPDPVCWTEAPQELRTLARQRNRWQRGLIDSLWANREMLFNPRYGSVGILACPFYLVFEMLGPLIEVAGLIAVVLSLFLGLVDGVFAIQFFCIAVLLGMVLSLSALVLEGLTYRRYTRISSVWILALYALLENLGYRQLIAACRLHGIVDRLRGYGAWGRMKRVGFDSSGERAGVELGAAADKEEVEEVWRVAVGDDLSLDTGPGSQAGPGSQTGSGAQVGSGTQAEAGAQAGPGTEVGSGAQAGSQVAIKVTRRDQSETVGPAPGHLVSHRAPVSPRVRFEVDVVDGGIRVMVHGRPDSAELLPFARLRKGMIARAAYDYTERHLGPRAEIGDKGGSLAKRLRAVLRNCSE